MSRVINFNSVGPVIRRLRTEAGRSLQDLAKELPCDRTTLHKYETNKRVLSLEMIEAIARALGHPPEVVVLLCLKHRYPKLSDPSSEIGQILEGIVYGAGPTDSSSSTISP